MSLFVPLKLIECAQKDRLPRDIRSEEKTLEETRRDARPRKVELKRAEHERLKHFEKSASEPD